MLAVLLAGCSDQAQPPSIDQAQVERAEDLSEALANQLHELSLSVRDGDMAAITTHFGDDLAVAVGALRVRPDHYIKRFCAI